MKLSLPKKILRPVWLKKPSPKKTVSEIKSVEEEKSVRKKVATVEVPESVPEPQARPILDAASINPNTATDNLKILQTYQNKNLTIGIFTVETEEALGHYAEAADPDSRDTGIKLAQVRRPCFHKSKNQPPLERKNSPEI